MILALDPGPTQTAYALWDGVRLVDGDIMPTPDVVECLWSGTLRGDVVAIEKIACFGMPVGAEVFDTCEWTGEMKSAVKRTGRRVRMVYRKEVKLHLCHSARAKDANIRQALIDRFGPTGTKKNPGPLFGARSHVWAALAVAVYAHDVPDGVPA